jgi:hypothetical protein
VFIAVTVNAWNPKEETFDQGLWILVSFFGGLVELYCLFAEVI